MPRPTLLVNDPIIVEEIYGAKNKYFDRNIVDQRIFKHIIKHSILASPSHEKWAILC
jgi:hypothetical protein